MLSLGIDCGSTTTKGALFDGKSIIKTAITPTAARPSERMEWVYNELYSSDIGFVVTTGYGRELFLKSDKKVTEITCHAKGAAFLTSDIVCVVDIGGQDSKAILLDRHQNVSDFLMNDKCAAGTGRFIEMMSRILDCNIDDIDTFVKGKTPVEISSMCTVFAESEIISLIAKGADRGDIALGVIRSICLRTSCFAQRLKPGGTVFFSGGLARFEIFRKTLEEFLCLPVVTNRQSQFAGAIGGAVIGYNKLLRM